MVRVERRLLLGTQAELGQALFHSEDSSTLNTSFIERHNLTRLVLYFVAYFQQSSKTPPGDIGFFLEDADFCALAEGKLS